MSTSSGFKPKAQSLVDVIVIGGGVTGLAAAHTLRRRGLSVLVFEASRRLGGLILTERVNGFTIEGGPDSLLAQKPAALQLCDEVGLTSDLILMSPPYRAFVLHGTRLYPLPRPSVLGIPLTWRALAGYDLLPWPARMRLAAEPLVAPRRDGRDESIASFFRRRFGAASVDLIAQPLLGGIHAGDINELSVTSLFPRLVDAEREHGSVMRGLAAHQGPPSKPRPGSSFVSLRGGMDALVTAVASRLPVEAVHLNAPVQSVRLEHGAWRVSAAGYEAAARAVIIAAPASTASRLLGAIDREAASLCSEVPYVSTASVALAWPRAAVPHPLAGSGFVVARGTGRGSSAMRAAHGRSSKDVRITACTWVSSKWEGRAPPGFVLLRAFIGGAHDPDVVDLGDDELTSIVRGDLSRVLGVSAVPTLARVYRWRNAGAQHLVGHLARMAALERRLAAHPGLFVAGSGFRATGIPDCVTDAQGAAAAAVDFCHR